jgi:magnesium transporter
MVEGEPGNKDPNSNEIQQELIEYLKDAEFGTPKFLAAVTIIISIPTLIASIYGMNVPLPGESGVQTFIYLLALSTLLSILVVVVFRRMDWL